MITFEGEQVVSLPSNAEFLDCVDSFERLEKPSNVIEKCNKAIQKGLDSVDEAIVHGLLMSTYAKERDLENTHQELLRAREAIGKVVGLAGEELQRFILNARHEAQIYTAIDDKIDPKEKLAENTMLRDIMLCPVYPSRSVDFREGLSEKKKRDATLEWCSDFPGIMLYLLLGDLWATHNIDYAIECLKILKKHEDVSEENPPTIAGLTTGYKLGMLYKVKGDVASAKKEYRDVLSALSHPKWHILPSDERQLAEYWIFRAKEEVAGIEQRSPVAPALFAENRGLPPPPPPPPAATCPSCGGQLAYIHQYQRFYCYKCKKYA